MYLYTLKNWLNDITYWSFWNTNQILLLLHLKLWRGVCGSLGHGQAFADAAGSTWNVLTNRLFHFPLPWNSAHSLHLQEFVWDQSPLLYLWGRCEVSLDELVLTTNSPCALLLLTRHASCSLPALSGHWICWGDYCLLDKQTVMKHKNRHDCHPLPPESLQRMKQVVGASMGHAMMLREGKGRLSVLPAPK